MQESFSAYNLVDFIFLVFIHQGLNILFAGEGPKDRFSMRARVFFGAVCCGGVALLRRSSLWFGAHLAQPQGHGWLSTKLMCTHKGVVCGCTII
jgi:hypothetical protein